MPACCGSPVVHVPAPSAFAAPAGLWLAVAFHAGDAGSSTGSAASISATVHAVFRLPAAARTLATSAGAMSDPVLPKLLRTYDVTAAIQSSVFDPIGT